MHSKALEVLEFGKIKEMLAREASTSLGRGMSMSLQPCDPDSAKDMQKLGREILDVLSRTTAPSLYAASDVRPRVHRAGQGVVLTGQDLREILNVLLAMDSLSRWLEHVEGQYPALYAMRGKVPRLPSLRTRLDATIDEDGLVRDSASPKLSSIRRSLKEYQDRLRRRAEEIARHRDISQYLQEAIVTVRNGRLVLPVKQEFAARIPGLVHDQSSSGQTLFLEPVEILEMGNQLRRLELQERDEVERILAEVSGLVGESSDALTKGVTALAEFDLGLAKARLALKWKGSFPDIVHGPRLHLREAWHPLLKGLPVPMNIDLSLDGVRTVVITGPNMGGKTVALKTCGLLSAMALAGMPCPCRGDTAIGAISDVLLDIGDQQSIEESLSTFSAHISNVKMILDNAGPGKLVLVDELGAGTDPLEGAALGLAILRRLNDSGALSVITSHFTELKLAAETNPGMQNASVEWDSVNLKPTYRLITGRPGRSNAFLVAKRLGLDPLILEEAKSNMSQEILQLEDVIADLEESSQKAREEALIAARERQLAESLKTQYESRLKSQERARKETLNEAKQEAAAIVSRARVEFEKAVREFRDKERLSGKELTARVQEMREKFRSVSQDLVPETAAPLSGEPLRPEDAVPGTMVYVAGFQDAATILEAPGSGDPAVLVRIGALSLRAPIENLRIAANVSSDRREPRPSASSIAMEKAQSVSAEVDLRGMTSDEAFLTLDKYLDDAILAGLSQVRVIHGKGTGALRRAVTEYLKGHRCVAESRLGEVSQGGSGVTVARLRSP